MRRRHLTEFAELQESYDQVLAELNTIRTEQEALRDLIADLREDQNRFLGAELQAMKNLLKKQLYVKDLEIITLQKINKYLDAWI